MPADAGVDHRGAHGLDGLTQLHHFLKAGATFHQIQHGQTVDDDEVRAHALTHALDDLDRESHAVLVRTTPLVGTLVGAGCDEFVDQVAFRAHDLHAVIAGLLGHGCAVGIVFHRLPHLFSRQLTRGHGGDRCLDRAGAHQARVIGVTAKVQDLHGDLAACGVHGIRHHLVLGGFFFGGHARTARVGAACIVGGDATRHHQRHATPGPFGIKRSHALETIRGLFQAHVHRAHQDAVAQRGEAQIQGLQQVGIGAHRQSLSVCG